MIVMRVFCIYLMTPSQWRNCSNHSRWSPLSTSFLDKYTYTHTHTHIYIYIYIYIYICKHPHTHTHTHTATKSGPRKRPLLEIPLYFESGAILKPIGHLWRSISAKITTFPKNSTTDVLLGSKYASVNNTDYSQIEFPPVWHC